MIKKLYPCINCGKKDILYYYHRNDGKGWRLLCEKCGNLLFNNKPDNPIRIQVDVLLYSHKDILEQESLDLSYSI